MNVFSCLPNDIFKGDDNLLLKHGDKLIIVMDYIFLRKFSFYNYSEFTIAKLILKSKFKLDRNVGSTNDKFKEVIESIHEEGLIELNKLGFKINDDIEAKINYPCKNEKGEYINFFKLYEEDKFKILEYNSKGIDKSKLLNLYCYFLSLISKDKPHCFPSYDDVEFTINISRRSIAKYIKILKGLNLIEYDNIGILVDHEGQIFKAGNVYVLKNNDNWKDNLKVALIESGKYYSSIGCFSRTDN